MIGRVMRVRSWSELLEVLESRVYVVGGWNLVLYEAMPKDVARC